MHEDVQQINADDISANLFDLYKSDATDATDATVSADSEIKTEDPTQNEEAVTETQTTEAQEPPTTTTVDTTPALTMNDVVAVNDLRDNLTKTYYDQQIEANKTELEAFLKNPDTGEAWSVEELTGSDNGGGYINKATGQVFTDAEAVSFIQNNRFNHQQSLANFQNNAAKISGLMTNASIDAKYVESKYGEYLAANPEKAESLDAAYRKLIKMSDDGRFIVDAPMSMREFYEMALSGVDLQKTTSSDNPQGDKVVETTQSSSSAQGASTQATEGQAANFSANNRTAVMDAALDDSRGANVGPDVAQPKQVDLATQIENELLKAYKEDKKRQNGNGNF